MTWGLIHYRVVYRDKAELKWLYKVAIYYAGASVFKGAFCAGVECSHVGKGSVGVRLSTICFLHWALVRQSG